MAKDYIVNFVAPENKLKFRCYANNRRQARNMVHYFVAVEENDVLIGGDGKYLLTVDNKDHEPSIKTDHVLGQDYWDKLKDLI